MRVQFQITNLKFEIRKTAAFCLHPSAFRLIARLFSCAGIVLLLGVNVVSQQRSFDVAAFDRERVLKAAKKYLSEPPITITASSSPRSAGRAHDFFSEGDYWWPDPQNPAGA